MEELTHPPDETNWQLVETLLNQGMSWEATQALEVQLLNQAMLEERKYRMKAKITSKVNPITGEHYLQLESGGVTLYRTHYFDDSEEFPELVELTAKAVKYGYTICEE